MTHASRRTRLMMGASLAAGSGAAIAGIALLVLAGYAVARAAARPPILDLALLFLGVRFFGLARPVLRYGERLASHDATLRQLRRVRREFCEACLPLAARLDDWRSGDLLARVAADVDTLQERFLRWQAPVVTVTVVGLVVVTVLAAFDWRLAAVFAAATTINGVLTPMLLDSSARAGGRRGLGARADAQAALTADIVSLLRGLDDVAAFGQEEAQLQRLAVRQAALDRFDRRDGAIDAWRAAITMAVSGVALILAASVLASRVEDGSLTGPWAVALALGLLGALEAVEILPPAWSARERVSAAARRVADVTTATPAVVETPQPEVWPASSHAPAVRLDDVSYGYDERLVLAGATLDVAPNEHVAIVGSSGAGKSTLLDLLCRFRDPVRGRIAIDGRDIRRAPLSQVRAALAVVPQHVHVFDATLRENVRLGRAGASDVDVRRVLAAVRLADLPGARAADLDAPLGEEGRRLSAGERQRLGVARIMLTDARLVLVDEPAAHLDVETEREVLAALRTWASGRTLLVVSHRLSAVRSFDRIAMLDAGRLVSGPHASLLSESTAYRDLWDAERRMLASV